MFSLNLRNVVNVYQFKYVYSYLLMTVYIVYCSLTDPVISGGITKSDLVGIPVCVVIKWVVSSCSQNLQIISRYNSLVYRCGSLAVCVKEKIGIRWDCQRHRHTCSVSKASAHLYKVPGNTAAALEYIVLDQYHSWFYLYVFSQAAIKAKKSNERFLFKVGFKLTTIYLPSHRIIRKTSDELSAMRV